MMGLEGFEKRDLKHFGLELRDWRMRDIGLALKAAVIILPPFIFFHLSQGGFGSPDKIFSLILTEIFLVGLPEEIFFRGYLQTHLEDVLPKRFELLEVKFGLGLCLTSALFALAHYMLRRDLLSLSVFFPALVFGWLKERTGRVLAPAVFLALSNIVYFLFPF